MINAIEIILIFLILTDLILLGSSRLRNAIRIVALQGVALGLLPLLTEGSVTWHGALLGLGSACAYSERGYLSDTTDTYFGEALAVVRADADADTMELTAADGTHNAACCIPCKE